MRGRPKTFDRDEALMKALEMFWEQGYAATAIGDLTRHMGIGRQSLYDTFGDKHSLFLEALRAYAERRLSMAREVLDAPGSAAANLKNFQDMVRAQLLDPDAVAGCMMATSASELGLDDPEVAEFLRSVTGRLEAILIRTIERAIADGEIAASASPQAMARLMICANNGLSVSSRMGMPPEAIGDVLDTLFGLFAGRRDQGADAIA